MKSKKISPKYSPEVRERAVRMVQEHRGEYPSLWAAIESIAPKIACVLQTLHEWVRKHEIDTGMRGRVRPGRLVCQRPIPSRSPWTAPSMASHRCG